MSALLLWFLLGAGLLGALALFTVILYVVYEIRREQAMNEAMVRYARRLRNDAIE